MNHIKDVAKRNWLRSGLILPLRALLPLRASSCGIALSSELRLVLHYKRLKTRYYLAILILITGFLSAYSQESDFMIKGKLISCSDTKDKPSGHIYLLKNSVVIDSVWTYHQTLFGDIFWTNGKFKFKGLQNGIYQIKYDTYFYTQDFPTFEINGSDLKGIEICYDKLPERYFKEETSLDRLELNDTLFINVHIAAGGEFGGYDEGFWIVKGQNGFK